MLLGMWMLFQWLVYIYARDVPEIHSVSLVGGVFIKYFTVCTANFTKFVHMYQVISLHSGNDL